MPLRASGSSQPGSVVPPCTSWRGSTSSLKIALGLFTVAVFVGLAFANDYGPSFDETFQAIYGKQVLTSYVTLTEAQDWHGNLKYYGPFFSALAEAATGLGGLIKASWRPETIRHLVTFLSLPISVLSVYLIAKRWTIPFAALIAALLFGTQPLIFGHAFINPKDMPFLAFFALSIALGLRMVDNVGTRGMWISDELTEAGGSEADLWSALLACMRTTTRRWRIAFAVLLALALIVAVELLRIEAVVQPLLLDLVRQAYDMESWEPINRLFTLVAQQSASLPASAYVAKAEGFYLAIKRPLTLAAFVPTFLLIVTSFKPLVQKIRPKRLFAAAIIAGATVGLTTAIRVVGPFAGLLITGLAIYRHRQGSIAPLVLYWLTAAAITYAAWPYLWGGPFLRFWESLEVMRNFEWEFPVLFRGIVYSGNTLPRYYVPYILSIQVTTVALVLAAAGAAVAIRNWRRAQYQSAEQVMVALWVLVPLAFAVAGAPAYYDNGRQYLFLLVPLFLFASLALGSFFGWIRSNLQRMVVSALILLPGVIAIMSLHPHEYIYYNEIVGGVRGAYRRYELDYWATSLKAGLEIINEIAEPHSTVYIDGPWENIWEYARNDLSLYDPPENSFDHRQASYLIVTSRANADLNYLQFGHEIDSIRSGNAKLTSVLQVHDPG